MRTLEDVLRKLEEWNIDPDEVPISRLAYDYVIKQAKEVLAVDEEEEEEE